MRTKHSRVVRLHREQFNKKQSSNYAIEDLISKTLSYITASFTSNLRLIPIDTKTSSGVYCMH